MSDGVKNWAFDAEKLIGHLKKRNMEGYFCATAEEAREAVKVLVKTEGILCGISSGAALVAAVKMQREEGTLPYLAILPDGGEKYLSTGLFE